MTLCRATLGPWSKPVEAPTVGRAAQLALALFDPGIQTSFLAGKLALTVQEWLKVFRQSVKGKCPWKVRSK